MHTHMYSHKFRLTRMQSHTYTHCHMPALPAGGPAEELVLQVGVAAWREG